MSALQYEFLIRDADLRAFDSPQLAAVRKGMYKQPLPVDWESGQSLPMPVEMTLRIREENSCPGATMQQQATAVGIVLAFCCLVRPSEYLHNTNSNAHILKAKSVSFEVTLLYSEPRWVGAH